jgi:antitoxin HigA-1
MNNLQDITQDRLIRPIHPGEVIVDILEVIFMNHIQKKKPIKEQ